MDNTKDKILHYAVDQVRTVGFDSFSYSDISKHLGIAKTSVHHHFPKKEDLGLSLLDKISQTGCAFFEQLYNSDSSSVKQIEMYLHEPLQKKHSGKICPLHSFQVEKNVLPASMRDKLQDITKQEIAFIAKILSEGKKSGEMNFNGKPLAQAEMIHAALKGALVYSHKNNRQSLRNIIEQIMYSLVIEQIL